MSILSKIFVLLLFFLIKIDKRILTVIFIDLGSVELKYSINPIKEKVYREKNVVLYDTKKESYILFGSEANKLIGRTSENLIPVYPIVKGKVVDFDSLLKIIYFLINQIKKHYFFIFKNPLLIFCVPYSISEVEINAIKEASRLNGSIKSFLFEEPVVQYIFIRDLYNKKFNTLMLVDISGTKTNVSIVNNFKVIKNIKLDFSIVFIENKLINYIKNKYQVLISIESIEEIIFSLLNKDSFITKQIIGQDILTFLPKKINLTFVEIKEYLLNLFEELFLEKLNEFFEKLTPEFFKDISKEGLFCVGKFFQIDIFYTFLESKLKFKINVITNEYINLLGLYKIYKNFDLFNKLYIKDDLLR